MILPDIFHAFLHCFVFDPFWAIAFESEDFPFLLGEYFPLFFQVLKLLPLDYFYDQFIIQKKNHSPLSHWKANQTDVQGHKALF
jgi:hypothetical protein